MRKVISRYMEVLVLSLFLLIGFGGLALAAGEATGPDKSLLDLAKPILDAVVHGQWWIAAMSALILAVSALKKYAPTEGKFGWVGRDLATTPGVMAYTFVLSFAGAAVTALVALGPSGVMSLAIAKTALLVAVAAIGTWRAVHEIATWFIGTAFYKNSVPAWAKSLIELALSLIGSNAVDKAEAAGQAAVEAKPATGATPDDFKTF